jgi:hypothetical protein
MRRNIRKKANDNGMGQMRTSGEAKLVRKRTTEIVYLVSSVFSSNHNRLTIVRAPA